MISSDKGGEQDGGQPSTVSETEDGEPIFGGL